MAKLDSTRVYGTLIVDNDFYLDGGITITNNTASTSTTTGALKVTGGVGVVGAMWVGGTSNAATFNATSTTNGGFQGIDADTASVPSFTWTGDQDTGMFRSATDTIGFTTGGTSRLTIANTLITAIQPISITNTTASTSTTTGALRVSGGVGVAGAMWVGGTSNAVTFNATSTTNGGFQGIDADTASVPSFTWTGDQDTGMWRTAADSIGFTTGGTNRLTIANTLITAAQPVSITDNTTATSTTTGALRVTGGAGIGGALFTGGAANIGSGSNTWALDGSSGSTFTLKDGSGTTRMSLTSGGVLTATSGFTAGTGTQSWVMDTTSADFYIKQGSGTPAEKLRINAGGDITGFGIWKNIRSRGRTSTLTTLNSGANAGPNISLTESVSQGDTLAIEMNSSNSASHNPKILIITLGHNSASPSASTSYTTGWIEYASTTQVYIYTISFSFSGSTLYNIGKYRQVISTTGVTMGAQVLYIGRIWKINQA
jgi:hypothetical protein